MIIICDECGQYFCPDSCPNFSGFIVGIGDPVRVCSLCESALYRKDKYFVFRDRTVCADCAERLIPPELLDLLDCFSPEDFFDLLRIDTCEA